MIGTRNAEAQIRYWMENPGNWRFKSLLAASLPESPYTSEEVGHALRSLAKAPEVKEHHLSKRPGPTPPTRELIRPLAYEGKDYNEPAEARELSGVSEKELEAGIDLDDYMGRMLVSSSPTEKDVLWREQLLDTVIQGAEEAKIARDVSNVVEVNTKKGDHPVRAAEIFAPVVAEGATITFDEQNWSTNSWTTEKFGLGSYITEELLDHAIIDLIDEQTRHLGAAVENALNRVFMNELVDNGGAGGSGSDIETSPSGTPDEVGVKDLLRLRNVPIAANFPAPDTLVMHDEVQLGLIANEDNNNLIFANRAGDLNSLSTGEFPQGLIGIENVAVVPDGPYNSTNTWGFASDGEFGAVMYPRELMFTYIRRDLETKDFDDPIRDLQGANVRAEYDSVWGQSAASARLKH